MGPSMADANRKLLNDAVERNAAAVLSLPIDGLLQHCKSRFLALVEQGIWIQSEPSRIDLIDTLIGRQAVVAVSFRNGHQKASFATTIVRRDAGFRVNDSTVVDAVLLETPDDVKSIQRRVDYRVSVGSDSDLAVRVWRISERADVRDVPMSAAELAVEVRDLSVGGMGISVKPSKPNEPPRIAQDERLRVLLKFGADEILMEGRVRHLPHGKPSESIRAGVQFAKLNKDIKGRQKRATLTRIIGMLQREEVRRARLKPAG